METEFVSDMETKKSRARLILLYFFALKSASKNNIEFKFY